MTRCRRVLPRQGFISDTAPLPPPTLSRQLVGFAVLWLDVEPPIERVEERFAPVLVRIWPPTEPNAFWPPPGGAFHFAHLDALADTIASLASAPRTLPTERA